MSEPCKDHFPISVMFTVRDMKKSVAFYRDTLGFDIEACWPDEGNPMWANMLLDGQSVMLGAAMKAEQAGEMCGANSAMREWSVSRARDFEKKGTGAGTVVYLKVPEVDAFHARVVKKGVKPGYAPTSQFYGIRDFAVADPDGNCLLFYSPIAMASCQSCGMPLKDAKPGAMYCQYCTDEQGKLKPYDAVLEGTIQGYFMAMQKMPRPQAEKAAREHLGKMPAWQGRAK
ncbi:MAG: VOC family protein [Planctomycetota bacterium]